MKGKTKILWKDHRALAEVAAYGGGHSLWTRQNDGSERRPLSERSGPGSTHEGLTEAEEAQDYLLTCMSLYVR